MFWTWMYFFLWRSQGNRPYIFDFTFDHNTESVNSESVITQDPLKGQEGGLRHSSETRSSPICTILMINFYVLAPHKDGKTWNSVWHEVKHSYEFWSSCCLCSLRYEQCHCSLQKCCISFFLLFYNFVYLLMQGKLLTWAKICEVLDLYWLEAGVIKDM